MSRRQQIVVVVTVLQFAFTIDTDESTTECIESSPSPSRPRPARPGNETLIRSHRTPPPTTRSASPPPGPSRRRHSPFLGPPGISHHKPPSPYAQVRPTTRPGSYLASNKIRDDKKPLPIARLPADRRTRGTIRCSAPLRRSRCPQRR